jgi:hypothetical protein
MNEARSVEIETEVEQSTVEECIVKALRCGKAPAPIVAITPLQEVRGQAPNWTKQL